MKQERPASAEEGYARDRSLAQIKEYIVSSVRNKLTGREVATVDWKKDEGKQVTEGVLKETLDVFGVTE